jgi:hypothetical protein
MDEIEKLKKLEAWYNLTQQIEGFKPIIEQEITLRKELVEAFFNTKIEGAQSIPLPNGGGWKVKATIKIERKINQVTLPTILATLREQQVPNTDALVTYKPTLAIKEYKSLQNLNKEAIKIFDQCLTIKPGTPTLEMVPPPAPIGEANG